ncbi:MAG: glycoside hydrolase family 28 protein [Verrucomicrobiota bacterium]
MKTLLKQGLALVLGAMVGLNVAQAGKIFDVRELGAKGDGKTDDTAVIQKALDDCGGTGGTVKLAKGNYYSRPLTIKTKTTLLIETGATLTATTNQNDFLKMPGDWTKAKSGGDFVPFLSGKDLEEVTIAGSGTIEGSGAVWWEAAEEARRKVSGFTLSRPNLIVLTRAKNLVVRDVTIQNSPKFHLVPTECDDVLITNVTILAPERAPNTDAIDPSVSRRVTITKCVIDVGDDNVAVKSGKRMDGREFAVEDLTITDCTFKHGHGMSIGSETVGGVKNVLVKNCTFEETDNGIRIKSDRKRGGTVDNFVCEDITMKNVRGAITLTSYYPKIPATDTAQPVTDTTPKYKNITIKNLAATSSKAAGVIVGLPESHIENVLLENVTIAAEQGGLEIRHAKGVTFKNVKVTAKKGEPFIVTDAEVSGLEAAVK